MKFQDTKLESFLKDIGAYAEEQGIDLYLVGGFVRDYLLNDQGISSVPESRDVDLMLSDDAIEFIEGYIKGDNPHNLKIIEAFEQFRTLKVDLDGSDYDIEFASSRVESYNEAAAFPKVQEATVKADLPRRDFTINALLISVNPEKFGEVFDYIKGLEDLEKRLVRVFHDKSFIDDPTRIYRAIRFMAKFDFQIEEHTEKLIKAAIAEADFDKWFKRRKNRFKIEFDFIKNLGEEKYKKALDYMQVHNIPLID